MEKLALQLLSWFQEAKRIIEEELKQPLAIQTKESFNDLVTNVDKKVQRFFVQKIKQQFPNDSILGEEDGLNQLSSMKGRVFIIDPIDGTLNFVLQQKNFCIMLGVYENKKAQLGFIYDVTRDELYWGGKTIGVFCNHTPLVKPVDKKLNEGLVGMNAYYYAHNILNAQKIGEQAMGVRITGCAGLEMIRLLKGEQIGYFSNLNPWDYAPGCALLDAFHIPFSQADGQALRFDKRSPFIAFLPSAYQTVRQKIDELRK